MRYENLKPTLADQVKWLLDQANKTHTVPHGVKTVNPGEGLQLLSEDGSEIFWDWSTADRWRADIDAGAAAVEQGKLDLAQARADLDAAQGRIDATNNDLLVLDDRVESAETTVQVTAGKLDTVDTRLTTTAGELAALSGTVGDVSAAVATAEGKAARAETAANQASAAASEAMSEYDGLRVKLDAALAARPGLITDSSFELPEQWVTSYGASIIASTAARTGSKLLVLPWQNTNTGTGKSVHVYSRQDVQVIKGHHYRLTVYLNSTGSIDGAKGNFLVRRGAAGSNAYITQTTRIDLVDSGITQGEWRVFQAEWTAPESYDVNFGFQAAFLASDLYVDDLQAVDSTAEASLQIAVEDARQKAEAAARDAVEAMRRADMAQSSANGKTNVMYTTTPYTGAGLNVGDTNFVLSTLGGGGIMQRQRRWGGNSWEDVQFGHQVIASVDLGKATVGELDGQRISARTLTADRFQVGVAGNLIVDPNFNDATVSNWRLGGRWQWGNTDGETYFRAWGNGTITDMGLNGGQSKAPSLPVASGTSYALTLDVKGTIGIYLSIRYANGHTNTPGSSIQTSPHSSTRRIHTFVITPDNYIVAGAEGTKPVEIQINLRQPSSAPVGGDTTVYSAKFAPRTSSVLIEDGAVTAEKVNAQSVAGAVGQFVKVQAENVEVTSELAARVVNAMTANVRNLVVTESAILQHTTLLGTTVASELNVTKLLRGRDAILTGTVDVAQLNVTETMSAEIVRSMDTTTKRLVVTEDAILNRATVVEGIVTSELIAQKINVEQLAAAMVTGGFIQTATAVNRGVKIDNNGIRAWDGSGRQTMNINGTSNYLTGEFSTAASGQRVKISNSGNIAAIDLYASRSTDDHVGMWYDSPDTNVLNSVGRVLAISGTSHTRDSPGMEMWPMRGTFGFKGRWQQETDATKFVELTNSTGIKAGEWAQITIPYQTPFPTNNSLRLPMVSVERLYGADVIANIVTESASSITVLVVNKSTSGSSGPIKVRAAIFNLNS